MWQPTKYYFLFHLYVSKATKVQTELINSWASADWRWISPLCCSRLKLPTDTVETKVKFGSNVMFSFTNNNQLMRFHQFCNLNKEWVNVPCKHYLLNAVTHDNHSHLTFMSPLTLNRHDRHDALLKMSVCCFTHLNWTHHDRWLLWKPWSSKWEYLVNGGSLWQIVSAHVTPSEEI